MDSTLPTHTPATMHRHEFFRLVGTSIGVILLSRCMAGCAQGGGDPTPDPSKKTDFSLKLSDPTNANLTVKGGYVIQEDVIVARTLADTYVAVSANCTHQGTQLVFKGADNQFYCPLHGSRFDTVGKVQVGPAVTSLTQYMVEVDKTTGVIRVHS